MVREEAEDEENADSGLGNIERIDDDVDSNEDDEELGNGCFLSSAIEMLNLTIIKSST